MALIDVAFVKDWLSGELLTDLTASTNDPFTANDNKINAAINRAHGKIYAKLHHLYKYPFEGPAPALDNLKGIEFSLTRYYLFSRKYADAEIKDVYAQYTKAHEDLDKYASGKLDAGLSKKEDDIEIPIATNKTSEDRRIEWV